MSTRVITPRAIDLQGTGFDHHTVRSVMLVVPLPREVGKAVATLAERDGVSISRWLFDAISIYPTDAWTSRARAGHQVLSSILSLDSLRKSAKAKADAARAEFVAGDSTRLAEVAAQEVKAAEYTRLMEQYINAGAKGRVRASDRQVGVTLRIDPFTSISLKAHAHSIGIKHTTFVRLIIAEVLASNGYGELVEDIRLGGIRDGIPLPARRAAYTALLRELDQGGFRSLTKTEVARHCERCARGKATEPPLRVLSRDSASALRSRILRAPIEAERLLLPPRPQRKAA